MTQKLITAFLILFLTVVCLCIRPLKAWDGQNSDYKSSKISSDIPNLKALKDSSWYVKPHRRLKAYQETCEEMARHAEKYRKVNPGFQAMCRASDHIERGIKASTASQNKNKNRNGHLFAYDETRSCQDIEGFYVNANDVETPAQNYMVTQGPLDDTVQDFWKAVVHNDSRVIVTLVMAEEEGKIKCASYWTIPQITFDDWTVTLTNVEHIATSPLIPSHKIVIRTFIAKNASTEKIIKQVHYENWPDGKVPDFDLFITLLDTVDKLIGDTNNPITVHCSAGIGRSGTFVASHSLRKEIRHANNQERKRGPLLINVPQAIFLLRCQRMGMVGTPRQYKVVYQTVAKEHKVRHLPYFIF
ncbi:MAG: tyrosine-protein phosphatase [Chlamydiales bacterium]|nr:tyrosine-protein phosphatase [Chlamydiales bacterium]